MHNVITKFSMEGYYKFKFFKDYIFVTYKNPFFTDQDQIQNLSLHSCIQV